LTSGVQYYVEITSGDNTGHRLEVNEANCTANSIAIDTASPRNTLATLPMSLATDHFLLKAHHTIKSLFPAAKFNATGTPTTADRILLYVNGAYDIYWLYTNGGSPKWVSAANATLADRGSEIIAPGAGFFVHVRGAPVSDTYAGTVRSNPMITRLATGTTFMGNGWPLAVSPNQRGMISANGFTMAAGPSTADKIMLWKQDTNLAASGYENLAYLSLGGTGRWVTLSNATLSNQGDSAMFASFRAAFIKTQAAITTHQLALPWTP
jgi:hypothetical protein